jgi:aminoglycoside phosphotransferase
MIREPTSSVRHELLGKLPTGLRTDGDRSLLHTSAPPHSTLPTTRPLQRRKASSASAIARPLVTATSERTIGSASASSPTIHVTLPGAIDDNAANLNFAESSLSDISAGRHCLMQPELRFEHLVELLPTDWQAALAGDEVEPILGMGGALVFRVLDSAGGCKYLKLASGLGARLLTREMARTEWVSSHHIRVPRFLMKTCTRINAVLMTAVPGRHLTLDTDDFLGAVRTMGRGLARLHALPSANCPFNETPRARLERAREAIEQNLLDASQFDDRNCGITPSTLYQRLDGAIPASEDIVVVHGDATLSNMLIGSDGELGFIDCGHSGRSDRYVDLAVIEAELLTEFGRDAVECFHDKYGTRQWDNQKAAFFRDLYELF